MKQRKFVAHVAVVIRDNETVGVQSGYPLPLCNIEAGSGSWPGLLPSGQVPKAHD
jgi:hypothetical protein